MVRMRKALTAGKTGRMVLVLALAAGALAAPAPDCMAEGLVGAEAAQSAADPAQAAQELPAVDDTEAESGALTGDGAYAEGEKETETEGQTDEALEELLSQVQSALPAENGSWSVYVADLVKGTEGSIDDHRMQAASLIKLYIMGAVYEQYDTLTEQYGKDVIDDTLYPMITVSDNTAANTLVEYLGNGDTSAGMTAVNDYCMAHGYYRTSMGRLLLQSNENGDNYTSVADCGHFLGMVYEGNTEENPHAEDMLALLAAQERRHKIPAQMPEGVSVANKTGELDTVENDAAILYDTANDLILVFMSEDLTDTGAAQSTIAQLARQCYDYYNVTIHSRFSDR